MPPLPEMLGQYRILSRLGRGAMGTVYKAEDTVLGRLVAIKVIQFPAGAEAGDEEEARKELRVRFDREARAAAALSHPNIVTVYQAGSHDAMPFIAMELVEGASLLAVLQARAQDGPGISLSRLELLRGICHVAEALDYAHSRGVIHRDIKPANVLVTRTGTFKVADFGIAKMNDATDITQSGVFVGTLGYSAPEILRGKPANRASDQYALGVLAFEALTKRLPFHAPSAEAMVYQVLHAPVPKPSAIDSRLSAAVDRVFSRVLEKDPLLRFANCAEFAGNLAVACDSSRSTDQAPPPKEQPKEWPENETPSRPPRSIPPLAWGLGIGILMVAAVLVLIWRSPPGNGGGVEAAATLALDNDPPAAGFIDRLPGASAAGTMPVSTNFPEHTTGPRNPAATLLIRRGKSDELRVVAVGQDGALYVATSGAHFWAIRDAKVLWGFESAGSLRYSEANIAADGLIGFGRTVFNSRGDGGVVRDDGNAQLQRIPEAPQRRRADRWEFCGTRQVLDHECENGTRDAAGNLYLISAAKEVYAFNKNRELLWRVQTPCRAPELMEFAAGTVVLGCFGAHSYRVAGLVGVRDGKVAWTFQPDNGAEIQYNFSPGHGNVLIDRTGTIYVADNGEPSRVYCLSNDGRMLWKASFGRNPIQEMRLGPIGRLFVSHRYDQANTFGHAVTVLSDQSN